MNLDVGEVLRHAWRITWNHKALWVFNALPMVPILFYLPLVVYVFLSNDFTSELSSLLNNPTLIFALVTLILLTTALSGILQVFGKSATTFGIVQIEADKVRPTFSEVSKGGRIFFWRILAVVFIASIVTSVFFAVFSACLSLIGLATVGLGAILGQLLVLPAALLIHATVEQSQAAIVADAKSPMDALAVAWELVKENIETFVLVSIVLHIGLSILGGLATLPILASLFIAVFNRFSVEFSDPSITRIAVSSFVALLPVYLLFQAVIVLYRKSVFMLMYLRLRRSLKLQPLPGS